MKVRAPSADSRYYDVRKLIHGAGLNTICEEARCPNIAECWGRGTATFQILGDTCTRACRYCYVHSGKPDGPPDPLEPLRLAQTAAQMSLEHVVVTSVDRDDLPDRGAAHYAATIRALRAKVPTASVEVLTPDFLGCEEEALATVLAERPDVFNHNIETVRRLHPSMRGAKASYDRALWLLRRAKEVADYAVLTKSGIIVGLGETNDEVVETMRDLREQRRRRGHDRPVPPAVLEARARSTAGCTRTSSAGSRSRARRSASARSSPGRSCAPRTGRTSRSTPRLRKRLEKPQSDPVADRYPPHMSRRFVVLALVAAAAVTAGGALAKPPGGPQPDPELTLPGSRLLRHCVKHRGRIRIRSPRAAPCRCLALPRRRPNSHARPWRQRGRQARTRASSSSCCRSASRR